MQNFIDKVAVITGGASGIGLAIATRLAEENCKIVLADIEQAALDKATATLGESGADVLGVHTDVSKIDSVRALCERTLSVYGRVNILCNNAGVHVHGPSWQISLKQWQWIIEVNLWGVIHGIHVFIPQMLSQNDECYIVNTSSIAGFVSAPMLSAYQATKYAVTSLSETLNLELQEKSAKIGVSVLCPGFVKTNLHESERNCPEQLKDSGTVHSYLQKLLKEFLSDCIVEGISPQRVADAVVDGIRNRRPYILTHPETASLLQRRMDQILSCLA